MTIVVAIVATIATTTSTTSSTTEGSTAALIGLNSLVVKLVLQCKSLAIALLKVLIPALIHTKWEHQRDLGDVCQVILLILDDANDVLVATLTEGIVDLLARTISLSFLLLFCP